MTDVALYEPQAVTLTSKQLSYIANTEFVPKAFRGNHAMIAAAIATARAYGIPDIIGLRNIHVVEGKAELSAAMMTALATRAGHKIEGEFGEDSATAIGERGDNGATMRVTFTLEQAKKAGLLSKKNWQSYDEDMLWARAVSRLCRRLFADCFLGAVYAPGELEGDDDTIEATAEELMDEPVALAEPVTDASENDLGREAAQVGTGSASADVEEAHIEETDPGEFVVPEGYQGAGKTLADVADGPAGPEWMAWAADNAKDTGLREAAAAFLGRLA